MILIFPPGIATSSVGAASNIGTSLIEKVPLQIQSCMSACYFVFINTHSHIAFFVFLIGNKTKDALNYYASSITTPSSSRYYSHGALWRRWQHRFSLSLIVVVIFRKSSSNANAFKSRQVVNSRQVKELNTAFGRDRELVEKLAGQVWPCWWALDDWWWWHWNWLWQYDWK